jgi:hypothetical protein
MAQIIGNDGGGIEIGPHGIRRIPPWDPGVLQQLHALAALANATSQLGNKKVGAQLASVTNKLAGVVVSQVEALFGPIDGEAGLVFDDPEGGFKCGSTGKPPVPIPPHRFVPTLPQMLAARLLESQLTSVGDSGMQQITESFANSK